MNTEIEHPAYVSHRTTFDVLLHLRKRLRDEYGVDITPEWEMRVVNGEHDAPLPFSLSDLVSAERERCAKIADDAVPSERGRKDCICHNAAVTQIAAKIRSGE